MKRLLLMLGSFLSIAGAAGLLIFGRAVVDVFEGVLTYRFVNPPEPLPSSLGGLGWMAFSGTALTLGLVVSGVAAVMRDAHKTISFAGRILHVVAGLLFFIGTVPLLWGTLAARRGFTTIAASPVTPRPEDAREIVEAAAPLFTVGCAILLIGSFIILVAGQVGYGSSQSRANGTRSVMGVIAATGAVVFGLFAVGFFIGVWLHGNALSAILSNTEFTPKPTDLARHLMGIFSKSSLAFILVGCQGILHIAATIFVPSPKPNAATKAKKL